LLKSLSQHISSSLLTSSHKAKILQALSLNSIKDKSRVTRI
jgi:hypothetical protein